MNARKIIDTNFIESKLFIGFLPLSPKGKSRGKYSNQGAFSVRSFKKHNLPASIIVALVAASNFSLAEGTFKSYKTAERHIIKCENDTKVKMRFPFGEKETLTYIGWLIGVRKVSAKTVEKYLSGIRFVHIKEGYHVPNLRPEIVKSVLTGLAQKEKVDLRMGKKAERLPVTISVLDLIRHELIKAPWAVARKRMILTVCYISFFGSFRIHEILARDKMTFDVQSTLLGNNLKVEYWPEKDSKVMKVWLKSPKELRNGTGVMVELFPTNNYLCPIRALEKWRNVSRIPKSEVKPVFRHEDGSNYTGKDFNEDLRKLLAKHLDYKKGKILSHSFRSGLATMMAKNGYSDDEIMRTGRWSSSAFLAYCKLGRVKRMAVAQEMASRFSKV